MMKIDEVLDELQQCSLALLNFDLTAKREKVMICFCDFDVLAQSEWDCDDWDLL